MAKKKSQPRKPRFTKEVLEQIPTWVADGLTVKEIAKKVGCGVTTLQTMCCSFKISLKRPNRSLRFMVRNGQTIPTLLFLSKDANDVIALKAVDLGLTTSQLCEKLLTTIAQDVLFEAILDEGGVSHIDVSNGAA